MGQGQQRWGQSIPLLPDTYAHPSLPPRKAVAFKKCTPSFHPSLSLFFLRFSFLFFALKSLSSTAVINQCWQDPLMNANVGGKAFLRNRLFAESRSSALKYLLITVGFLANTHEFFGTPPSRRQNFGLPLPMCVELRNLLIKVEYAKRKICPF